MLPARGRLNGLRQSSRYTISAPTPCSVSAELAPGAGGCRAAVALDEAREPAEDVVVWARITRLSLTRDGTAATTKLIRR